MNQTTQQVVEKKIISALEFEKRVQSEAQNMMYFERVKEHTAMQEAKKYIQTKFQVA